MGCTRTPKATRSWHRWRKRRLGRHSKRNKECSLGTPASPGFSEMMHKITVIRGDGVGPEVCDAAMRVIEATGVKCQWDFALVGREAEKEFGAPLPVQTLEKIRASRVALKGPVIIE